MEHPRPEELQLYIDRRLHDSARRLIDEHLERCAPCSEQVGSLRQLLEGLDSFAELSLPADFASDLAEEVAPSERLHVAPARRSLLVQVAICLIIMLTAGALLTIVDTPVTDPSDDVLGLIDVMLGSPFQADANIVAVLAIMAVAGMGILACVLMGLPRSRPVRRDPAPSRVPRKRH